MNRLTKRIKKGFYKCYDNVAVTNKLGRYEDTEEKIGINLNILTITFKTLKNGIWYVDDEGILFSKNVKIYYDDLLEIYRLIIDDCHYLRVVDYKDTWALTRKDLEI